MAGVKCFLDLCIFEDRLQSLDQDTILKSRPNCVCKIPARRESPLFGLCSNSFRPLLLCHRDSVDWSTFWTLFFHLFSTLPNELKSAQNTLASILAPAKTRNCPFGRGKKCSGPSGQALTPPCSRPLCKCADFGAVEHPANLVKFYMVPNDLYRCLT